MTRVLACKSLSLGILVLLGCGGLLAQSVKVSGEGSIPLTEARFRKEYVVLPGDQLDVVVRRVPEATRSVIVRPDGRITLPLINTDLSVAGLTTREINVKLIELLSTRLVRPEVTVMAGQVHPATVYIGGEVNVPGAIPLRNAEMAIQAISLAGGLKRSASARDIVIIRLGEDGKVLSLPVAVTSRGQRAPFEALARTRLFPDDIIFVPESGRSQVIRFIDDYINRPLQGVNSIFGTYVNYKLIRIINKTAQ